MELTEIYSKYQEIIAIFDKFPTLSEQLLHTHSEVDEVYDTIRRKDKYEYPELQCAEEISDVILSIIACAIKNKIPKDDLNRIMSMTINKNRKWALNKVKEQSIQ